MSRLIGTELRDRREYSRWTKRLTSVQVKIKVDYIPYDEQIRIAHQVKTRVDWCR
jgi:hypothetical protein